jgi:hypothetical protein
MDRFRVAALVLGCLLVGTGLGRGYATMSPTFTASARVFTNLAPSFSAYSATLAGTTGNWYDVANLPAIAQGQFLRKSKDFRLLRSFIASYANKFSPPLRNADELETVAKRVLVTPMVINKDSGDPFVEFRFQFGREVSGVDFLNAYLAKLVLETSAEMREQGRTGLETLKSNYQLELARLRMLRDLTAKQKVFDYQESLSIAKAAGIDKPVLDNLIGTTAVVTGSPKGETPLFYYGTKILQEQIGALTHRIGNDEAIPEWPTLESATQIVEQRLLKMDSVQISPVVSDSARLSNGFGIGVWTGLGAMLGFCLAILIIWLGHQFKTNRVSIPVIGRAS